MDVEALSFHRSVTAPGPTADFSPSKFRRGVTEPAKEDAYRISKFHEASMEDNPLSMPREQVATDFLQNLALCTVNLLAGCCVPAIVDYSRSATCRDKEQEWKCFPYNPASLIMADSGANVIFGLAMMLRKQQPLTGLMELQPHVDMLSLTLIYCVGDLCALLAIGSGGGLLYLTVANSRLLFAAMASTLLMNQQLRCEQWASLGIIEASIVFFAANHVTEDASGWQGATVALFFALLKSLLSAVSAVLTERRYKTKSIWEQNVLMKSQAFVVAWGLALLNEPLSVCPEEGPVLGKCISYRGWDRWTTWSFIAEFGNGWLSVAILRRLNAIAKFICKAASAPSLYLAYWLMGWSQFQLKLFISVIVMAASIVFYANEQISKLRQLQLPTWPAAYGVKPKGIS